MESTRNFRRLYHTIETFMDEDFSKQKRKEGNKKEKTMKNIFCYEYYDRLSNGKR